MQVVFGIDVSKATSTVCELIGQSKNEITITNDLSSFHSATKGSNYFL